MCLSATKSHVLRTIERMNVSTTRKSITLFALLTVGLPASLTGAMPDDGAKEVGRTTERELNVVLSASMGTVFIARGEPEKVLVIESPRNDDRVNLNYTIRNRVGYADVVLGDSDGDRERKHGTFKVTHFNGGDWSLRFTDAIPVSFDIELGVGKAEFDLTGLRVKDFKVSSGASDVYMVINEPNKTVIDHLNIESGVSKFIGRNLSNANFKHFTFQGGLGAYTLDFGGTLTSEVDVDVEVGLGVVTIIVPPEIGARVFYDKSFMSRLDYDRDFASVGENEYITDNYSSAHGKMNIRIDSGLGSVKIRRR